MKFVFLILCPIILLMASLQVWRRLDDQADMSVWARLASHQPANPGRYYPSMVAGLPEPAQRFFNYAIGSGTLLYTVAEISMEGQFSLGTKEQPKYMPMLAEQILAVPYGFVWKLKAGQGFVRVSGSDAAEEGNSRSRFWLLGVAPVARIGGDSDHARAAFGRYVAEAIFWTPAAVLPSDYVEWQAIDELSARMIMTYNSLSQAVDISVDDEGKLTKVLFQRWSDANPDKQYKLQPFGGYLTEYKEFDGYRLPTKVDAGNFFETEDYFPFFRENITSIGFPKQVGD